MIAEAAVPEILIVDRDEGNAILTQQALIDAGIDNPIERFRDVAALVVFLEEKRPESRDLLLLDLRTSITDWLRAVERDPALSNITAVALALTDDPRESRAAWDAGIPVVSKPLEVAELVADIGMLGTLHLDRSPATSRASFHFSPIR